MLWAIEANQPKEACCRASRRDKGTTHLFCRRQRQMQHAWRSIKAMTCASGHRRHVSVAATTAVRAR